MLTQLHIRNFTIIDSTELDLQSGMTSLTGETGAGKSILLDAIGLVLGDRADSSTVRPGADRAEINASFSIEDNATVKQWLRDHDLDDDELCLLRRIVASEGKSRGYINARPVSMQTLRTVGEMLVDIHGQHEHYTLSQRSTHRKVLDSTLPNSKLLEQVEQAYQQWQNVQEKIDAVQEDSNARSQRIDMLRFQVQEFDALTLNSEELSSIEEEHRRNANAGQLLEFANKALRHLDGDDDNAEALLQASMRQLQQLQALDPAISDCVEIVNTSTMLTQEASASLRDYIDRIDVDGARLQYLDERLSKLHSLAKKHRCDISELLTIQHALTKQLSELDGDGSDVEKMQSECDALLALYHTQASKLTRQRRKAATKLGEDVTNAMNSLGMQGGEFSVDLATEQTQTSRFGHDSVRFLVSPNPGMKAGDITRIASGGELSRISLALALVTRNELTFPTLIFDEVDAGIGGAVAVTVGEYLRKLGQKKQVLCVTHLAQVAAQADQHLRVSKEVVKGQTRTLLTQLHGEDTVDEIARMLGGAKLTKKSRQHAKELLNEQE